MTSAFPGRLPTWQFWPKQVGEVNGWVCGDYVTEESSYSYGETKEEEQKRMEAEEAAAAARAVKTLGGEILEIRDANLNAYDISHKIIVIKKVKNTASKFPRKAGTPTKEPLL